MDVDVDVKIGFGDGKESIEMDGESGIDEETGEGI